jgi:hypothetical protein
LLSNTRNIQKKVRWKSPEKVDHGLFFADFSFLGKTKDQHVESFVLEGKVHKKSTFLGDIFETAVYPNMSLQVNTPDENPDQTDHQEDASPLTLAMMEV